MRNMWPISSHKGTDPHASLARTLPLGRYVTLGAQASGWPSPRGTTACRASMPRFAGTATAGVRRLPTARNPIFVKGRQASEVRNRGRANTSSSARPRSRWPTSGPSVARRPQPAQQQTFSFAVSAKDQFRHADAHIDVLSRLPEVISGASSDRSSTCGWSTCCWPACRGPAAAALVAVKHLRRRAAGDRSAALGPPAGRPATIFSPASG